jgi:hypothetical protein
MDAEDRIFTSPPIAMGGLFLSKARFAAGFGPGIATELRTLDPDVMIEKNRSIVRL